MASTIPSYVIESLAISEMLIDRGTLFLTARKTTLLLCHNVIIPVTRRVQGYTRFVGKYVTGRRKRFRPHKVYIFLIRITSRVDLAKSVCLSVCPDER